MCLNLTEPFGKSIFIQWKIKMESYVEQQNA